MSTTNRAAARTKGLRLAARVGAVGGIAIAAIGLCEAHAAASATGPAPTAAAVASHDDRQPLPMESMVTGARGGNCGCAPCWGPPAPPEKGTSRAGRAS